MTIILKKDQTGQMFKTFLSGLILLSVVSIATIFIFKIKSSYIENSQGQIFLAEDKEIEIHTEIDAQVHVGEPFDYVIRIIYRQDRITPDLRKLLRDISFKPFEQRHKTRTRISEIFNQDSIHQYTISYTVVGIDVIPGTNYNLDTITVNYLQPGTDTISSISTIPPQVFIEPYYYEDPLGVNLQPVKGQAADNSMVFQALLYFCLVVFLLLAVGLVSAILRTERFKAESFADQIKTKYLKIKSGMDAGREKIIEYEKLVLSLFNAYGEVTARRFWRSGIKSDHSLWSKYGNLIRPPLETAYSYSGPSEMDVRSMENNFDGVYLEIEQLSDNERKDLNQLLNGNVQRKIRKNLFSILAATIATVISLLFLVLLMNQELWINRDSKVFNDWMNSIPPRLLDEDRQHDLNNLDIEMLGHISDQHRVMEKLNTDVLRSSYLYNYGTMATNIYKSILMMPSQEEEEEAAEPPTFEFPLQLMANAARFNPADEDVRRNLELIIALKESQKKEDSGEVQGELGPPTPGFSRDMNPLLF